MSESGRTGEHALRTWRRSLTPARRPAGDAALVRAAQKGSEAAVEELFSRHWSAAYRAAQLVTGDRAAAEDIAQEAFLAALRALDRFDVRRPLRPWLHRIVVNRAIDWSRARALRAEVGADVAPEPATTPGGETLDDDVAAALATLSPEHRAVVVLRYVLEFTPGEIGRILELPRGTVNSRLRRGLDAMREAIDGTRRVMRERQIAERLRGSAAVDPAARERSWRVVQAAYAGGLPVAAPRRRRLAPLFAAVALGLAALAGATAAAAPHSTVGHFIRSVLGTAPAREPAPTLRGFPGSGRLLVQASGNTWVVSGDGHRRRLGGYAGASWSPRGLFVVAWRGRDLTALEPGGTARWAVSAPGQVSVARWAPGDGYRIAYLVGGGLRIVNGDGTGDHAFAAARAGVAPAWRPHADHELAYVDRVGVTVVAVDGGAVLGRSVPLGAPARLAWSASGRRLLAVTRRRIVLLDARGRQIASRLLAPGVVVRAIAWSPRSPVAAVSLTDPRLGGQIALLALGHDRLTMRTLLAGPDRYGNVAWSPMGRRLLVQWPAADEWLFVDTQLEGRTHAVTGIARAFAPGASHARFPASADWCCPP